MSRMIVADADPDTGLQMAGLAIDGTVEAFEVDPPSRDFLPGEVRRARVTGRIGGVDDGVIVDLGDGEGFLSLRRRQRARIGETVMVQVEVPPRDGKRARVVSDVRLVGRTLIATTESALSLSRGLGDREAAADRARAMGLDWGWILRAGFEGADDAEIETEAQLLSRRRGLLAGEGPPERLLPGPGAVERLWTDWASGTERLDQSAVDRMPDWTGLRGARGDTGGMEAIDLLAVLARESVPEIALPSGGRITVERTRAVIAVDVDSGRAGAAKSNREAAVATARALRLRNLAGLIVIDPVRGSDGAGAPIEALREATRLDVRQVDIAPRPSRFGLIELTRARRGLALDEILSSTMIGNSRTDHDREA